MPDVYDEAVIAIACRLPDAKPASIPEKSNILFSRSARGELSNRELGGVFIHFLTIQPNDRIDNQVAPERIMAKESAL